MDYITYIRSLVGSNKIILNASACIIVNDENKILLQLRGDDHFWGLPGGIMEMNETFEDTCLREVHEETGYNIEIESLLGSYHNPNKMWPNGDQAHIICHIFKGNIIGGVQHIDMKETLDLQYFSVTDLPPIDAIDHLQAIHQFFGI